jgi:hypothetical protein
MFAIDWRGVKNDRKQFGCRPKPNSDEFASS